MSEWIDAKENPPPCVNGKYIIAAWNDECCSYPYKLLIYNRRAWIQDDIYYSEFDYWMPWEPFELPNQIHQCKITYRDGFESLQCIEYEKGKLKIIGNSNHGTLVIDTIFCPVCGKKAYK